MKIEPLFSKIVVKKEAAEEVRASGIILPDGQKEEAPQKGRVLKVGSDVTAVEAGDEVLFTAYAPSVFKVGEEEYLILEECDVMALVV